ncbi:Glycoside Hydrolase Family 13 protein [Trametes cinnabarina]|uniref:Glycoside Hydrolase Family 13 protein n=1 Tax=Pycnoporus cinnabarinus TaxID=5643 RepID=A0A060STJ2_PYCCI|nr:Glycoside Hydrolase Family 13 protein [Trametes cinnabarina]
MIWDALADSLLKTWEWLTLWRNPPPALPNMRLSPDGRDENALMVQFFTWEAMHPEMTWWKHFESEVPNLAALGVTQVWLPPPNKAMRKEGQGYDAYDLWDLGEFYQKGTIATRWGTKEEVVRAIASANAHGIDVLIDAVLNHKLGADRPEKFMAVPVDPNNRLRDLGPPREIEGWTAFDFLGRGDKYSSFKWTHEHFTGLDWDHRTRSKGVYRITSSPYQGWSRWVDSELGNYDYLLGIDTTGGAGFRLDAIKHMDRRFLLSFVTFFDVPLHYNFHDASKASSSYDLRKILDNTILKYRPSDAVTFVDNHDKSGKHWKAGAPQVGTNFKLQAYALVLLYGEGHP